MPHPEPTLDTPVTRRTALLGTLALVATRTAAGAPPVPVEVWKGPDCECCGDWVRHLEASGFRVTAHASGDTDARRRLGMPLELGSCHTASVEGYALEGHVPAREIRRLLKERPDALGLAVPAMPRGSPGMDGPALRGVRDPYDVLLVLRDRRWRVYQSYA